MSSCSTITSNISNANLYHRMSTTPCNICKAPAYFKCSTCEETSRPFTLYCQDCYGNLHQDFKDHVRESITCCTYCTSTAAKYYCHHCEAHYCEKHNNYIHGPHTLNNHNVRNILKRPRSLHYSDFDSDSEAEPEPEPARTCHFCPTNPKHATISCTQCAKEEVFLCTSCHHKVHQKCQHVISFIKRQSKEQDSTPNAQCKPSQNFTSTCSELDCMFHLAPVSFIFKILQIIVTNLSSIDGERRIRVGNRGIINC